MKRLRGKKILAFAGIEARTFQIIEREWLKIKQEISFPDHYNYKKSEVKNLMLLAKEIYKLLQQKKIILE